MGSMAPYLGKSQCDVNLTKEQLGFLDTLRIMAFYIACGYSIMLYDWIVTLDQERRRIWRARWSLGKVLFLWNRYHALAGFGILLYAFTSYWDQDVCER